MINGLLKSNDVLLKEVKDEDKCINEVLMSTQFLVTFLTGGFAAQSHSE